MLFLIPIILVGIWWLYHQRSGGVESPNPLFRRFLRPSRLYLLSTLLISLIGVSIILLIAELSYDREIRVIEPVSPEIVLVLDISKSMLAEDITPSRLDRAKELLDGFIGSAQKEKIGLILFAGKAFVMSPPTLDHTGLRHILSFVTPDTIRQDLPGLSGTAIGDAILLANQTLSGSGQTSRDIILLTDGTKNIGSDPLIAALESQSQQIRISSIGIGRSSETYLYTTDRASGERRFFYDGAGEKIRAEIDLDSLARLSEETGGRSYTASDESAFSEILGSLRSEKSPPPQIMNQTLSTPLSPWIALIITVLLVTEWGVFARYRYIFEKKLEKKNISI